MSISKKYGRTYHYPFSPGTTNDDRVNIDYWEDIGRLQQVVHTEKLDGENNCLSRYGVFARSHAAPTTSVWTQDIRRRWQMIQHDLGDLEIFGENLYAVHSIEYRALAHYFYVFAVRQLDMWLSWDEVKFYASLFDFPTVPQLDTVRPRDEVSFVKDVIALSEDPSGLDAWDTSSNKSCTREGVVTRDIGAFPVGDFERHVFKYVRKGHVKTDEHWTRNWRRAKLISEFRQS
jgi:hypothetical protein